MEETYRTSGQKTFKVVASVNMKQKTFYSITFFRPPPPVSVLVAAFSVSSISHTYTSAVFLFFHRFHQLLCVARNPSPSGCLTSAAPEVRQAALCCCAHAAHTHTHLGMCVCVCERVL